MDTIKELRSEHGCPWDSRQTILSLRKYLVEEFDEILAALDHKDSANLCEELGDFLYLILMIGEISKEEGNFDVSRIIASINEKLIRRHPHVFDTKEQLSEGELRKQWQRIKETEKSERNNS
jgi:tetrapyrrole methylase family protein / MazG family protein